MKSKHWLALTILLVAVGVGIRFYRLTQPPLDFHPTRQYRSLLLARTLYLRWRPGPISPEEVAQRAAGFRVALHEPVLFETLVARTYLLLHGECPWVARLYDLAFWLFGALGLWMLARRLGGPAGAAVAVGYWMLLPLAIAASRSFQPDPLMVSLLPWVAYGWFRWVEDGHARWLIWAGLAGLLAGIVKVHAVFFFGGMALGAAWGRRGWKFWREVRWWGVVVGILLLVAGIYLKIRPGQWVSFYVSTWTLRMARYWLTPLPYGGWLDMIVRNLGGGLTLAAAVGGLRSERPAQGFLSGWLLGYLAYGFLVPVQIATHSYYHLPMVPWVALGLALTVRLLTPWVRSWPRGAQAVGAVLMLLAAVYPVGITYWEMRSHDYRAQAAMYAEIGRRLPPREKVVALTEAYGWPLLYHGGVPSVRWPSQDQKRLFDKQGQFAALFRSLVKAQDAAFFVVTDWEELGRQGNLRRYLRQCYPVWVETATYVIFDLRKENAQCAVP
ncbi:MAG TPA: glycosyltransferase family 39 protein [Anaerolineae bacterium]|nr:glycosyltransferase family 39 protein [Anaerolineae bacterium]HIQ08922.1 hypothetical protein [Anaerolineaceae bacterium]